MNKIQDTVLLFNLIFWITLSQTETESGLKSFLGKYIAKVSSGHISKFPQIFLSRI
jgi:hypothetical protein